MEECPLEGDVRLASFGILCRCGISFRGRPLKLRQDFAQRRNQLIARNVALLELNPELERLVLRLELKNKRLWPLRSCLFLATFAARFIAGEPALHDAVKHLNHFLFGRLPRNLEQQGLRKESGILRRDSVSVTDDRARPIFFAMSSCVYSNCAPRRWSPSASSNGVKSFR